MDSDGGYVLLVLNLVAFVDDIISVGQPLNMIGRKVGHIDERHSVAVIGEQKELSCVFVLRILCGCIFEFLQVLRRKVTLLRRFFQLGDLEAAFSERIGCLRADTLPVRLIQYRPQCLEIIFAGIALATPLLQERIEIAYVTQVNVGKQPLIQLAVVIFEQSKRFEIAFGVARMSGIPQRLDMIFKVCAEFALFGGVQKCFLKLIQRPVDAVYLELLDNLAGAGLYLVQKGIVLNAFFIGLPLLFAFQIPFDGKSFGRIVPIGRIDV